MFGGPFFRLFFIGRFLFWAPFGCSAGKKETTLTWRGRTAERRKERKKEVTSTWRESRSLSPKRSVGLQNPKALKGVLGCKTLIPKQSVGLQHPKP